MGWIESGVLEQRMKFVLACRAGEASVSELCRQFAVSRKTGHKWLGRYAAEGIGGLNDRSRAPLHCPHGLSAEVERVVLLVRRRHPTWGPKKVRAWLEAHEENRRWPACSTMSDLFAREGLVHRRRRRWRTPPRGRPFALCGGPNDLWCADFKGWFMTGDGARCEPFTLSDADSRYLLRTQAVRRHDVAHVWPLFDAAFREFGLPLALRSDNGPPFASTGAGGLSPLSILLIKAGVTPDWIEPGCPQQHGRHERLHLTLKQDTATPPAASLAAQARRFARFARIYNEERPHEALAMATPASRYAPSPRSWSGRLTSPSYDSTLSIRKLRTNGAIKWRGQEIYISQTLAGEPVGLEQQDDGAWQVKYGPVLLGHIDGKGVFRRPKKRRKSQPPARGFVDKPNALPTTPPAQQQQ